MGTQRLLFGILLELFAMAMNAMSSGMESSWVVVALIGLIVGFWGLRTPAGKS